MSRERNMIDESARTSAESAFEAIEDMIVTGELPSLHLMSESDLARRTGFGRTPVREALQRLKFVGLVDVLPRRGVVVTAVDINRQLDLLETRRPLEKLMVRLAASRASDEQRNRMSDIADDLREAVATGDQTNSSSPTGPFTRLRHKRRQTRFSFPNWPSFTVCRGGSGTSIFRTAIPSPAPLNSTPLSWPRSYLVMGMQQRRLRGRFWIVSNKSRETQL